MPLAKQEQEKVIFGKEKAKQKIKSNISRFIKELSFFVKTILKALELISQH